MSPVALGRNLRHDTVRVHLRTAPRSLCTRRTKREQEGYGSGKCGATTLPWTATASWSRRQPTGFHPGSREVGDPGRRRRVICFLVRPALELHHPIVTAGVSQTKVCETQILA